jgi:hypothetical protein
MYLERVSPEYLLRGEAVLEAGQRHEVDNEPKHPCGEAGDRSMTVTSTSARRNVFAAKSPPNPQPMVTTWCRVAPADFERTRSMAMCSVLQL